MKRGGLIKAKLVSRKLMPIFECKRDFVIRNIFFYSITNVYVYQNLGLYSLFFLAFIILVYLVVMYACFVIKRISVNKRSLIENSQTFELHERIKDIT